MALGYSRGLQAGGGVVRSEPAGQFPTVLWPTMPRKDHGPQERGCLIVRNNRLGSGVQTAYFGSCSIGSHGPSVRLAACQQRPREAPSAADRLYAYALHVDASLFTSVDGLSNVERRCY